MDFKTYNLGLSAWLSIAGHECTVESDPRDHKKAVFKFARDSELDRLVADYHSSNASVDPRLFKQTETELKLLMFAVLDRGGQR